MGPLHGQMCAVGTRVLASVLRLVQLPLACSLAAAITPRVCGCPHRSRNGHMTSRDWTAARYLAHCTRRGSDALPFCAKEVENRLVGLGSAVWGESCSCTLEYNSILARLAQWQNYRPSGVLSRRICDVGYSAKFSVRPWLRPASTPEEKVFEGRAGEVVYSFMFYI